MENKTRDLIELIVSNTKLHTLWLNTLSFLEHVGSRKILKSQNSQKLDMMVLEHVAEEARHALFFKKLCQKLDPDACPTYEFEYILGGDKTEHYFQNLDQMIDEELAHQHSDLARSRLTYLYVTLLVEERAMQVYETYEEILKGNNIAMSLRPVLNEEQRHLEQMKTLLVRLDKKHDDNHRMFQKIEAKLFESLLTRLENHARQMLNKRSLAKNFN